MIIVGVSQWHNSSVCLLNDGEVVFHSENERHSRKKYDNNSFDIITRVPKHIDHLCIAGLTAQESKNENYESFLKDKGFIINNTHKIWQTHHKWHATSAFYNSGFKKAICVVKDGMGSDYPLLDKRFQNDTYGRESGTTFLAEYPHSFTEIDKHITVNFEYNDKIKHISINQSGSEGLLYQKLSKKFGFFELDAGKVMGMSAYGKSNNVNIFKNGYVDNTLLKFKNNDLTKGYINRDFNSFEEQCNFSFELQRQTQEHLLNYIFKMIEKTGVKNVCLSGGFFLNCVANYHLLKKLPKDVKLYVEPISSDAGTSIGIAKYYHHKITKDNTIRPQNSLYYGLKYEYTKQEIEHIFSDCKIKKTTPNDVATLLKDNNIVALYQGKAESGPRALGNRSLLFNPGHQNGQYIVNTIKKREKFRPFACTILNEHKDEWFDLKHMKDSKFMMYAVDCFKPDKIPAVNHVDNTCRIQTLKFNDNQKFYDLINCFYVQTKLPMLLNTSLNLAGDPIVETLEDLKEMLDKCSLNYIYLAEFDLLISKL